MKNWTLDQKILLVLIAIQSEEISEAKGCELLGWNRDRIREELPKRVGRLTLLEQEMLEALQYVRKFGGQGEIIEEGDRNGKSVSYYVEEAIRKAVAKQGIR